MIKKLLKYTAIAAIWIAIWQIAAMLVGEELLFPAPLPVLLRLCEMVCEADFYRTVGTSILRVVAGMAIGTFLGVIGGAICALVRPAHDFFAPMLAVVKSTPVASFIILLVLWISRDLTPVIIASIMVLPVVWVNVEAGIINTDRNLIEMARVYGMSRGRIVTQIYLPSIYPYFISSLRSSLGMSWKAGIAAEVLLQPLIAIGKQIFEAKYMLETVDLFAWTVVVIILSVAIEQLMLLLLKLSLKVGSFSLAGGKKYDGV